VYNIAVQGGGEWENAENEIADIFEATADVGYASNPNVLSVLRLI